MDYEMGSIDGAYKGRLHVAWPFIVIRNTWRGSGAALHEYVRVLLQLQQFLYLKTSTTLHMVHGNMYLRTYGSHLHRRTMLMRMFWVTMGMHVSFVTPSLTPRRFPCVTSVSCNMCC